MDAQQLDLIIQRGKLGILSVAEQKEIAEELAYYRGAALRLERVVHERVKLREDAMKEEGARLLPQ